MPCSEGLRRSRASRHSARRPAPVWQPGVVRLVCGAGSPRRDPTKPASPAQFPPRYRGQLLGTVDRPRLGDSGQWWFVHIGGDIPTCHLMGRVLDWERVGIEAKHVIIRPAETDWTRQMRQHLDAEHRAFKIKNFGPRPQGSTSIERLDSLLEQTVEIQRLASQVDKPHAWADVASCWHIKGLRRPIQQAFAQIGWDRINWLVHANTGWPADLVQLVEQEIAKRPSTGGKLPFYVDDYLLQD